MLKAASIVVTCKEFSTRASEKGKTGIAMVKTQGGGSTDNFNFAHLYGFNPEFPLEPGAQYLVTFTRIGDTLCA